MQRKFLLGSCALTALLTLAGTGRAQDLSATPRAPAPPSETALPTDKEQIQFSADTLDYDSEADIVTASGDVRMYRDADRLRANKIVWNRKTGQVVATGDIVVSNPAGDAAYGDSVELTDTLKDGVVENMLVVLDQGGRIAAARGTRSEEKIMLEDAAYSPCAVLDSNDCPKQPSWKITAVQVVYDPARHRIFYKGARINLFGVAAFPLPSFSNPVGGGTDSGFLAPDIRYGRVNGAEYAQPYYFSFAPNRGLKVTPRLYSAALPLLSLEYSALNSTGAYRIGGWGTVSQRTDTLTNATTTQNAFRGYIEGVGRFQLSPEWSLSGSIRIATDSTFLRRYDISRDDLLRNTIKLERIDRNSYFSVTGWAVQTLRVGDRQALQPFAFPEIDYRRRINDPLLGGKLELQLNTLAIGRTAGQDTQRAFVSARWDLRRITRFGQEITLTAYARGDVYNANDTAATSVALYRGTEGFQARGIAALALDVKWPLIGRFLNGTQQLTPHVQIVASPKIANLIVPNEDSRSFDLEDSNLFALNRFPGYDRFGGTTRIVYGVEWAVTLPDLTLNANIGQSYRFSSQPDFVPTGTGLSDSASDIVGRTVLRYREFVSLTHRYRLDKDGLAIRRNEIDATIGTAGTYLLLGYLRLNRNITPTLEDLRDSEEARVGARVQFHRFWSVFGSAVINLTDRAEDPLSLTDGYAPVRHRLGIAYEDDCVKLGLTWKRDYRDTGDARRGDSFLLTLAFTNLGR
ncbi:MAG: organic solvent tolerance protein [Sphingomonas sp. 28-66-16]|nr:MAG: organic solvent tolerance protein [Sphingomonas sp. 28-66-16]